MQSLQGKESFRDESKERLCWRLSKIVLFELQMGKGGWEMTS